jgi:hypothetical protein
VEDERAPLSIGEPVEQTNEVKVFDLRSRRRNRRLPERMGSLELSPPPATDSQMVQNRAAPRCRVRMCRELVPVLPRPRQCLLEQVLSVRDVARVEVGERSKVLSRGDEEAFEGLRFRLAMGSPCSPTFTNARDPGCAASDPLPSPAGAVGWTSTMAPTS